MLGAAQEQQVIVLPKIIPNHILYPVPLRQRLMPPKAMKHERCSLTTDGKFYFQIQLNWHEPKKRFHKRTAKAMIKWLQAYVEWSEQK